jgi:hypothetical protein
MSLARRQARRSAMPRLVPGRAMQRRMAAGQAHSLRVATRERRPRRCEASPGAYPGFVSRLFGAFSGWQRAGFP